MAENTNEVKGQTNETPETPSVDELTKQIADLTSQLEKSKKALNTASSEAADWKKQFRATQDEATRLQAEKDEEFKALQEKLASYEKQTAMATHKANMIAMGYPEDLAVKRAGLLADGKITEAMAVEKEFIEYFGKQLKAEGMRNTPAPLSGSAVTPSVTKDTFAKMTIRERSELLEKDPELYAQFTK